MVAIRDYAVVLSRMSQQQIQEVLDDVLNTTDVPEDVRPVVLTFNARLMTELRQLKCWPPYLGGKDAGE